jgi:NtrC-family two-component system sensor histidine kinase KinB
MKIKTKLTLGIGLLFLLIILLGIIGTKYINELKADTENILVDNYHSLEYARYMLSALDDTGSNSIAILENNLKKQESNATEVGEKEATQALRDNFNSYKTDPVNDAVVWKMRDKIYKIMDLNMQAIQRKSEIAKKTANAANIWIGITAALCFTIAFTLLVNLPSNIANPIQELTESIKQVAAQNYHQRVHFEGRDEYGELAKSFNTMAQKLEEYSESKLEKILQEKKRIEMLINNMHDPVIGVDEHLKIIFANEEAVKIIGLKHNELVGNDIQKLALKNDLLSMLIQNLADAEQAIETKPKAIKIFANEKESYFEKETLHITITPTGEELSKLIGHVIILRNITEFKELDFAKTNFIATVSHEFKTPISSIKMSLQLLENKHIGQVNEEQSHLLHSIKDDADRLLKITGELLNMTQVESGNIQLSILPSDPREILQYAIQATKIQAEQKQVKFDISYPDHIPKVQADNEKTTWVLINLISNAIRYSHENSVIYISISPTAGYTKISVKDTGQGIAPEYKYKIFDRYFRVPGTKKEGTGLGLAISKEFMEAQGGQISVESDLGAGSMFTISLKSST